MITNSARRRTLATADYQGLAELRYRLRQFAVFSEGAARLTGLTAQQHQALLAVLGFPGKQHVTIGALAERLGLRHHSAVGLVDRLVARRLLRRSHGARDRRQVWVDVTPRARALLARLARVHRDELRRVAPLLRALLQRLGTPRRLVRGGGRRAT